MSPEGRVESFSEKHILNSKKYVCLSNLKSNKETHKPCTLPEFHGNSSTSEGLHVPHPSPHRDGHCPELCVNHSLLS